MILSERNSREHASRDGKREVVVYDYVMRVRPCLHKWRRGGRLAIARWAIRSSSCPGDAVPNARATAYGILLGTASVATTPTLETS